MKNLRLVIGIVVILAIVCTPALAISIADFRATQSKFESTIRTTPSFSRTIPEIKHTFPSIIPTPTPTPSVYEENTTCCCGPLKIFEKNRVWTPNEPYIYSHLPAPRIEIYGPAPGMSDEEYWEILARYAPGIRYL
jgi:hypothetical protein